ncbi:DUF6231 family protein [Marinobacter sp. 1Y8]
MLLTTLEQLLADNQPKRLIVAGETAQKVGQAWSAHADAELVDVTDRIAEAASEQSVVADLALVTEVMGAIDHEQARQFIGWLRNAGALKVAVCIVESDDWTFNDMIALGFERYASFDNQSALYTYDIETYNRARDWNNPKHWANPENWGKYRW